MADAYIGLGSNLESPEDQIQNAIVAIGRIPDTKIIRLSSCYQSSPVGPQNQPDYINAVVHITTGLSADGLLEQLQYIEDKQGRTREVRWGARTIDLDLLLYGDAVINEKNLIVPHPEMHNRAFVLYPLHEIAPTIQIPGMGSIEQLLQKINSDDLRKLGNYDK